MRNILIAGALFGVLAYPTISSAQSSVTLYGLIDEGFNDTSNVGGHSNYQLESGFAQGSRWVLKGTEDLGSKANRSFRRASINATAS